MDVVLPIVKESEDIIEQCESDDDDEVYETVNAKHTELVEKCVKHRKIFKFVIDNILSMSFR